MFLSPRDVELSSNEIRLSRERERCNAKKQTSLIFWIGE